MFCGNCGKEIKEGSAFCPNCGSPTGNAARPTGGMVQPAGNMVTEFGKSPLTLVLAILMSAYVLFAFIGGMDTVLNVFQLIGIGVTCVGCWFVYVRCYQNSAGKIGFYIILIGMVIYFAFTVINYISLMVVGARWYYGGLRAAMIILYLAVAVVYVWCFYGLFLTTNDGLKIMGGEPARWRTYLPSIVIIFALAVFIFVGIITDLRSPYIVYYYSNPGIAILAMFLSLAVYIVAGVILIMIRKKTLEMRG